MPPPGPLVAEPRSSVGPTPGMAFVLSFQSRVPAVDGEENKPLANAVVAILVLAFGLVCVVDTLAEVAVAALPVVFWFSVGMSAATTARNVGAPAVPFGAANTKLAVLEA